MKKVLGAFLASRLLLEIAMTWSLWRHPLYQTVGHWQTHPDVPWLDGWLRWDSGWYTSIFFEGYQYVPGQQCNATFFPLYPFVSGLLSKVVALFVAQPTAFHIAALVVSNVGFFAGLLGLLRLGESLTSEASARRSVWLAAFYPFSFFCSAVYTEGLFFGLAVWTFVLAREQRWSGAFMLAGLAVLCRPHGVVLAAALCLEYAWRTGLPRRLERRDLAVGWIAIGVGVLLLVYGHLTGHPLAFAKAQSVWYGGIPRPGLLAEIRDIWSDAPFNALRQGVSLAILCAWVLAAWPIARRYGPGYALFTFLSVALTGHTSLYGLGRYAGMAFPVFLLAGERVRGAAFTLLLGISTALMIVFAVGFARWFAMT